MVPLDTLLERESVSGIVSRLAADRAITDAELSRRSDVSRGTISKFKRGVTDPRLSVVMRLFRALDVEIYLKGAE